MKFSLESEIERKQKEATDQPGFSAERGGTDGDKMPSDSTNCGAIDILNTKSRVEKSRSDEGLRNSVQSKSDRPQEDPEQLPAPAELRGNLPRENTLRPRCGPAWP
ncbi:hypothetical protein QAD02_012362 [Eretmocerus hayati]|uniref:Uncharacterized protein n=1 Tax=Eretmocerus hayati TaxID=131215 RepID=A0ACC2P472_9HYME|nr:hypothetical protein QAD02_012362 [Eretmocerus hayati]